VIGLELLARGGNDDPLSQYLDLRDRRVQVKFAARSRKLFAELLGEHVVALLAFDRFGLREVVVRLTMKRATADCSQVGEKALLCGPCPVRIRELNFECSAGYRRAILLSDPIRQLRAVEPVGIRSLPALVRICDLGRFGADARNDRLHFVIDAFGLLRGKQPTIEIERSIEIECGKRLFRGEDEKSQPEFLGQ
jgi:hypothetical protein